MDGWKVVDEGWKPVSCVNWFFNECIAPVNSRGFFMIADCLFLNQNSNN